MEIIINNTTIQIYEGAKVKDVLRKLSMTTYKEVTAGKMVVVNQHNHRVGLEGELAGSEKLFIVKTEEV